MLWRTRVIRYEHNCPADVNRDGLRNAQDDIDFMEHYMVGEPEADLVLDQAATLDDVAAYQNLPK
jgi:hypothetical protein